MEVRDIVQEAGIKTIPMEKFCKKAKWLSRPSSGAQVAEGCVNFSPMTEQLECLGVG